MNTKKNTTMLTIVTGFSIFTMLFGAGNFMVPPKLGMLAGQKSLLASLGFMITGVVLPIVGLMGSFLFEGDYRTFFFRIGAIPGSILIAACMFITGPGLVLPRILNICFEMLHPFIPSMTLFGYAIFMSLVTFTLAYRPTKLIDILGYFITPIKLSLIAVLIFLGFYFGHDLIHVDISNADLFGKSLLSGYQTLDLLAIVFFGSVILDAFRNNLDAQEAGDMRKLIKRGLMASLVGGCILAPVYVGLTFLGAYHGAGLEGLNEAQILSTISFRIIGTSGGFFAAIALVVACLATMIALQPLLVNTFKKKSPEIV